MTESVALILQKPDTDRRERPFRVENREDGSTALQLLLHPAIIEAAMDGPWCLNPHNKITADDQVTHYMRELTIKSGLFRKKPTEHLAFETLYDDKMEMVHQRFRFVTAGVHVLDYLEVNKLQNERERFNPVAQQFYRQQSFAQAAQRKEGFPASGTPYPMSIVKSLFVETNNGVTGYLRENHLAGFSKIRDPAQPRWEWPLRVSSGEDLTTGVLYDHMADCHLNMVQAVHHEMTGFPLISRPKTLVERINFHNAQVQLLSAEQKKQKQTSVSPTVHTPS